MDRILYISRGFAGWHAEGLSKDGNRFSSSGGTLEDYLQQAAEGCMVVDAENADYSTYAKHVIAGPMLDVSLDPGSVKRFQDREALAFMLPGLGGSFKTVASLNLSGLSSLDYVGADVYRQLVRQIPGIKLGKVQDGRIDWEPLPIA